MWRITLRGTYATRCIELNGGDKSLRKFTPNALALSQHIRICLLLYSMPAMASSRTNSGKKAKSSDLIALSNPVLTNFSPQFPQKVRSARAWQNVVDMICEELKLPGKLLVTFGFSPSCGRYRRQRHGELPFGPFVTLWLAVLICASQISTLGPG